MSKKALEKLYGLINDCTINVELSEYEGEPFAIVSEWRDVHNIGVHLHQYLDDVDAPANEYDDSAIHALFPFQWGFSDEWAMCPHCSLVIRTSPTHYGWTPDYWESSYDMACGDCVRSDLTEEYVDWLIWNASEGTAVGCNLVHPEDHKFTLIAENLSHGLHEGMNDDPREVVKWGSVIGLQVVFTIQPSQFYIKFDVWARTDEGEWLSESQVDGIKRALLDGEGCLRHEFRQWPTPAQVMKEALKSPVVHKVSQQDFIDGKALDHGVDAPVVQIIIE